MLEPEVERRPRAGQLVLAPDCGMKYLSSEIVFKKLEAMVAGARTFAKSSLPDS